MYWAEALAAQTKDQVASYICSYCKERKETQQLILLIGTQGKPQEIGGYYQPNSELTNKAMRPSII
jgi:isocitrate dehydrogenase